MQGKAGIKMAENLRARLRHINEKASSFLRRLATLEKGAQVVKQGTGRATGGQSEERRVILYVGTERPGKEKSKLAPWEKLMGRIVRSMERIAGEPGVNLCGNVYHAMKRKILGLESLRELSREQVVKKIGSCIFSHMMEFSRLVYIVLDWSREVEREIRMRRVRSEEQHLKVFQHLRENTLAALYLIEQKHKNDLSMLHKGFVYVFIILFDALSKVRDDLSDVLFFGSRILVNKELKDHILSNIFNIIYLWDKIQWFLLSLSHIAYFDHSEGMRDLERTVHYILKP